MASGAGTLVENSELPVDLRGFFLIDRAEGALYGWAREGVARWSLAQRTLSTLHALLISGRSGFTQDARHLYWYDRPALMRFPKP